MQKTAQRLDQRRRYSVPEIAMPYGSRMIRVRIPGENHVQTVVPREVRPARDGDAEVASSLDHPIGSSRLEEKS